MSEAPDGAAVPIVVSSESDVSAKLQAETRRLNAVREVARALGSTLELDRLLDVILHQITDVMEADRSTLYLVTDDGAGLWSKITQGEGRIIIRLRLGEGIAGWVAQEGRTLRIDDAYADPRFNKEVDRRSGYMTRTILCCPMRNNAGKIVGVIQVLNRRGGPFSADDQSLLETLASQAAISIDNSRLYQEAIQKHAELRETHAALTKRVAELDLLYQVEREMHEAHSLDEMLDRLLEQATERIGAEAGSILLHDRPGDALHFRATRGPVGVAIRELEVAGGEGIAGWVAETGESVVVNDPSSDPRFHRKMADELGFQPSNLLCVPLDSGEGTLGSFELLSKRAPGGFDESDLRLLTLIAGQASKALQLARVKDERLKESRLASIGQMLSGLLHDLKTPMTIVSGYAQLMARTDEASQRDAHVAEVLKQLEVMNAMAREVLSFARGESHLLLRRVMLSTFLRELDGHLKAQFQGRHVDLVIEPGDRGPAVFDESKFLRVVYNLARNAADAMPSGGTFTMGVQRDGDGVVWKFADTGCGIPREVERRLFQAFTTGGKADGTGLGLAIVKKIVDDHGGTITYETAAGKGTTFHIRLPQTTDDGAK